MRGRGRFVKISRRVAAPGPATGRRRADRCRGLSTSPSRRRRPRPTTSRRPPTTSPRLSAAAAGRASGADRASEGDLVLAEEEVRVSEEVVRVSAEEVADKVGRTSTTTVSRVIVVILGNTFSRATQNLCGGSKNIFYARPQHGARGCREFCCFNWIGHFWEESVCSGLRKPLQL